MKYRVILSDSDIRKLDISLTDILEVEDFRKVVGEKLNLSQFNIQYADADFNNEFCNVEDVACLSQTNTLKIILKAAAPDLGANDNEPSTSGLRERGDLPVPYILPEFDLETKVVLDSMQKEFMSSSAMYLPPRHEKGRILSCLSADIFKYKSYPSDGDCDIVAKTLVASFPCLKEKGGPLGYEAWKSSLKFKMGNLRNKLRRAGVAEAVANGGRKSKYTATGIHPSSAIKKARRSEANYLPTIPDSQTAQSLEENIETMKLEVSKVHRDVRLLSKLMSKTFATRRQEIVGSKPRPMTSDVADRWPALFDETQLCAEFARVCGIDLLGTFFQTLDGYTASLIDLLSGRGGIHGPAIAEELSDMRSKGDTAVLKRTFVLRCLLLYFGEDRSDLYRDFCVEDEPKVAEEDVPPFIAVLGDKYEGRCAIVVEKAIVVGGIEDFPKAVALFMGFIYSMDMEYPGKPKSLMFEFLQKVVLGLKGNEKHLSKRLNTLKNKL